MKLKTASAIVATLLLAFAPRWGNASQTKPDVWQPVRFMVGEWRGTSEGQPGKGTVQRAYAFVLHDRFLHEKNVSTYPPQPANKNGEVHEHWSFFSYDRQRKVIVLRQFHQESFVIQYILSDSESKAGKLVFVSESFENLDNRWRAKESYDITSADEFIETFEIAMPGKEFQLYSRNHFKRLK